MPRVPRKLLLGDEGNSALHYLDLDRPEQSFTFYGPGRDLQLVGGGRVLRSSPQGFVELDLKRSGALAREVSLTELPGGIESARRLPNGNTLLLGNGGGGIFVWELDPAGAVVRGRELRFQGLEKGRLLRITEAGTLLFCSDAPGRHLVHEANWADGVATLFEVPEGVPADSMVKAVRVAAHVVTVSTGYSASLLRIDTRSRQVLQTIGGKGQAEPPGLRRALSPHFFSGYQMFANGDFLVANWQGHGPEHGAKGYQLLLYSGAGELVWSFDQAQYPSLASINNVIALDELDIERLHDEPNGVLVPVG